MAVLAHNEELIHHDVFSSTRGLTLCSQTIMVAGTAHHINMASDLMQEQKQCWTKDL